MFLITLLKSSKKAFFQEHLIKLWTLKETVDNQIEAEMVKSSLTRFDNNKEIIREKNPNTKKFLWIIPCHPHLLLFFEVFVWEKLISIGTRWFTVRFYSYAMQKF